MVAAEGAAERDRFQRELAREIHDEVQHLLVTLAQRLDPASRLIREAPERAGRIAAAETDTARRAADEMRYLVRRLRAAPVDLAAALRTLVAGTADRWPLELVVRPLRRCPASRRLPITRCCG
ncbi:MAG: histidine kinase [Armatimonadota bacterium]|nr:histidine kinase [Armatimonadota bacterium]MDR7611363.1 histidine kinase [Armatimonadota bacterium]